MMPKPHLVIESKTISYVLYYVVLIGDEGALLVGTHLGWRSLEEAEEYKRFYEKNVLRTDEVVEIDGPTPEERLTEILSSSEGVEVYRPDE